MVRVFISKDGGNKVVNFSTSTNKQYVRSYRTSSNKQYTTAYQYQQTTVNLKSVNLWLPYILSIDALGNQLTGQVTVDGKVIKRLKGSSTQINLSPYLSIGKHRVEIAANYSPSSSRIAVELSGPDTAVTQQTSGSGVLRHALTIIVN